MVIVEAALPNTSENTSSRLKLEMVRQFCARFFSPVVKPVISNDNRTDPEAGGYLPEG